METARSLQGLPDDELMRRLHDLAGRARRVEADLVAHIGEVDARHLTIENREKLLRRATHQPERRIEELIAALAPKPDVPATVRKLPERTLAPVTAVSHASDSTAGRQSSTDEGLSQLVPDRVTIGNIPPRGAPPNAKPAGARPAVAPLSAARYRVQFTAGAALRDKLERLQALMRTAGPEVDLAAAIESAVTEKLERLEARRFGKTSRPRKTVADASVTPSSRSIPAPIRRAVHERDGGRCRYS